MAATGRQDGRPIKMTGRLVSQSIESGRVELVYEWPASELNGEMAQEELFTLMRAAWLLEFSVEVTEYLNVEDDDLIVRFRAYMGDETE